MAALSLGRGAAASLSSSRSLAVPARAPSVALLPRSSSSSSNSSSSSPCSIATTGGATVAAAGAQPRTSRRRSVRARATVTEIPTPIVKIDNTTDPFATKVTVEFGDRLGELLDTMTALKNLGLDIRKAKVDVAAAAQAAAGGNGNGGGSAVRSKPSTFYITEASTSEKVLKSSRLEEIRLTIIQNMLQYHPESGEVLAIGGRSPAARASSLSARDPTSPLGASKRADVQTTIAVRDAPTGSCSLLHITTRDRPGLLVDVVSVLKDVNVNVVSAEVDTIGETADDELFVTYHGAPLSGPMTQLVTNALQYYLSLAEVAKEESY